MRLIAAPRYSYLALPPLPASAWKIPAHMLSAAIAYQVLRQENPQTIDKVKEVTGETSLVREPMAGEASGCSRRRSRPRVVYAGRKVPDDIRFRDKQHHRGLWHYINWPFKPGQAGVQIRETDPVNILTALAENESVVKNGNDGERRTICGTLPDKFAAISIKGHWLDRCKSHALSTSLSLHSYRRCPN